MNETVDPVMNRHESASEVLVGRYRGRRKSHSNCPPCERNIVEFHPGIVYLRLHSVAKDIEWGADFVRIAGEAGGRIFQGFLETNPAHQVLKYLVVHSRGYRLIDGIPLTRRLQLGDNLAQRVLNPGHPAF